MPVSYSNAAFSPVLQQLQGWMQHQLQLVNDVKDCLQQMLQAMPHNKLGVWDMLDMLQCPSHELKHNTHGCLAIPSSVGATYFTQPPFPWRLCCITSCMHSKAINIHSNKYCISCITFYRDYMNNCMHCKMHSHHGCLSMPIYLSSAAYWPVLQQLQGWMQHQLQLSNDVKDCLQQMLQAMPHNKHNVWDMLNM